MTGNLFAGDDFGERGAAIALRDRDLDKLFSRLSASTFRSRFKLGRKEQDYLAKRGRQVILDQASDFVTKRLAPKEPANDGRQTPMRGHPVFIAQHATATCCRSCLSKWHGIAKGLILDTDHQVYMVAVIARWLDHGLSSPSHSPNADGGDFELR